jgi:hypothetical protein
MAEKKFGTRTFSTTPLLARDALVLQMRLLKAVGPAMSRLPEVLGGAKGDEEAKARANAVALEALSGIFVNADPKAMADLMGDIIACAQIRRPSGSVDTADLDGDFSGEQMQDLLPVAAWVLREQFGTFFSGLRANGSLGALAKG